MSPIVFLLFGPLAAMPILEVTSDSQCPAATDIEARVRGILDPKGSRRVDESANVKREGGSLRVSLRAIDGRATYERVLTADASCDELAQVVAVVLSSWISDVHPEYVGSLPQSNAPPTLEAIAPLDAATPTDEAATRPAPTSSSVAPLHALDARPSSAPSSMPRRIEFGAGLGLGVSGPSAAAAGSLMLMWIAPSSGWGWSLGATFTWPREQTLGDGALEWRRWPIGTGPVLRVPAGRALVDLGVGGAFSWLHLRGRAFPTTSTGDDFTFGTVGSVRVTLAAGKIVPFAAVTGCWWFAPSQAYVSPDRGSLELPRYDLFVLAGAVLLP